MVGEPPAADDFLIDDNYPADAAGGCCYLTLASVGEIDETVQTEHGPQTVRRRERVVVTPREIPFEGRICLSERIVRHLARKFGMVDGHTVARIETDNRELRAELADMSVQLRRQADTIDMLMAAERAVPEKVWVAIDGTEHARLRAARERSTEVFLAGVQGVQA